MNWKKGKNWIFIDRDVLNNKIISERSAYNIYIWRISMSTLYQSFLLLLLIYRNYFLNLKFLWSVLIIHKPFGRSQGSQFMVSVTASSTWSRGLLTIPWSLREGYVTLVNWCNVTLHFLRNWTFEQPLEFSIKNRIC